MLENALQHWATRFKTNVKSQHGEDGILKEIFKRIGVTNQWCVECGALNGLHHSNTWYFINDLDWRALLIEADPTWFAQLEKNYLGKSGVVCVNEFINFEGPGHVEVIFAERKLPKDFDLFVLDIDGNEYHIWESMKTYRPRVMMVEFNQTIPNDVSFIQPRDMSIQQGSSLAALRSLGIKKDYVLVAVTDINAIFVRCEDATLFASESSELHVLRPDNPYETKVFQLYDGTLKFSGNLSFIWRGGIIDEKKLQIFSPRRRYFPNGINSKSWVRTFKHIVRNSALYPVVRKLRKVELIRRIIK